MSTQAPTQTAPPATIAATGPTTAASNPPSTLASGQAPQYTTRNSAFIRPRNREGVSDCRSVTWTTLPSVPAAASITSSTPRTSSGAVIVASGTARVHPARSSEVTMSERPGRAGPFDIIHDHSGFAGLVA